MRLLPKVWNSSVASKIAVFSSQLLHDRLST
ncbi:hypothetical protein A2U01_0100518, partial [Trifolium medium]|nr:hypothetical protein [Trifolium medium]